MGEVIKFLPENWLVALAVKQSINKFSKEDPVKYSGMLEKEKNLFSYLLKNLDNEAA